MGIGQWREGIEDLNHMHESGLDGKLGGNSVENGVAILGLPKDSWQFFFDVFLGGWQVGWQGEKHKK